MRIVLAIFSSDARSCGSLFGIAKILGCRMLMAKVRPLRSTILARGGRSLTSDSNCLLALLRSFSFNSVGRTASCAYRATMNAPAKAKAPPNKLTRRWVSFLAVNANHLWLFLFLRIFFNAFTLHFLPRILGAQNIGFRGEVELNLSAVGLIAQSRITHSSLNRC